VIFGKSLHLEGVCFVEHDVSGWFVSNFASNFASNFNKLAFTTSIFDK
jgi:hypothetical protein